MRDVLVVALSAAVTVAGVRLYDRVLAPLLWERRLRQQCAAREAPCVLDVARDNVATFKQGKRGGVPAILRDLKDACMAPHLIELVRCALIARGAAKAFLIREELVNYKKVVYHNVVSLERLEVYVRRLLSMFYCDVDQGTAAERQRAIILHRHLATMRGLLRGLRDVRKWTKTICMVHRCPLPGDARLFIAGDEAVIKAPANLEITTMRKYYEALVDKYSNEMRELTEVEGWPPKSCMLKEGMGKHKHRCKVCKNTFGKVWVTAQVCWNCDDKARSQGRCPFERGQPPTICPHSRLCISCEGASCADCRVIRGNGDDVCALENQLKPHVVFLDWDQTLCNTRSGCRPDPTIHGLNPPLLAMAQRHPRVHIVTRQSPKHATSIMAFLSLAGMQCISKEGTNSSSASDSDGEKADGGGQGCYHLHCLGGKKEKKSAVVERVLRLGEIGMFVDDTAREVVSMRANDSVHGVVFKSNDFSHKVISNPKK